MHKRSGWAGLVILAACAAASPAWGQGETTAGPGVGAVAPDFTLPGATRYGLLKAPVRLSDYKGQTVVLAFFFKARTKG